MSCRFRYFRFGLFLFFGDAHDAFSLICLHRLATKHNASLLLSLVAQMPARRITAETFHSGHSFRR